MKAIFVFIRDVSVQIMSDTELSVKLMYQHKPYDIMWETYLLKRDTVVGQIKKTVISDGFFGDFNQLGPDCWFGRIYQSELDGVEFGVVKILGGFGRWCPRRDCRLERMIRGIEWCGHDGYVDMVN
jgi:hypothetical protein